MLTKPLIRFLLPHQKATTSFLSDGNTPKSIQIPLIDQDSFIEFAGNHNVPRPDSIRGFLTRPTRTVHYYWRQFDDSFMRPVFGGRGFVPFVPGSPTEREPPTDLSRAWEKCMWFKVCKLFICNIVCEDRELSCHLRFESSKQTLWKCSDCNVYYIQCICLLCKMEQKTLHLLMCVLNFVTVSNLTGPVWNGLIRFWNIKRKLFFVILTTSPNQWLQ